jgi:hypothetical protein
LQQVTLQQRQPVWHRQLVCGGWCVWMLVLQPVRVTALMVGRPQIGRVLLLPCACWIPLGVA